MQCGAACLAMIVNSYGVKCSLEYVSQMLHIGKKWRLNVCYYRGCK